MDNNCRTCKWFNKGYCYCKNTIHNVKDKQDLKIELQCVLEDGYCSEAIREAIDVDDLAKIIINRLKTNDYIKKTKLNKLYNESFEELEPLITESLDNIIYETIVPIVANGSTKTTGIEIYNSDEFCCCNWE